jgi:hypothetical protein
VRFDYVDREVDPLPGEIGPQVIHEPIIVVRFVGPAGAWLIRGLLDTGASMTLVPRSYMSRLGVTFGERVRLSTAAGGLNVLLGTLDLELGSGRAACRWSAQVGFLPRSDNLALLGHIGFLEHFAVTFDGLRKRVTLRPNGTFPPPAIDVE